MTFNNLRNILNYSEVFERHTWRTFSLSQKTVAKLKKFF